MSDDLISRKAVIDILENMIFVAGKDLSKSYLLQDAKERISRLNIAFDKEKVLEIVRGIPGISNDRIIILPEGVKPGDRVYEIYRFCGEGAWEVDVHQFRLEDIPRMGRTVFTSMKEAENAIERRKKFERR